MNPPFYNFLKERYLPERMIKSFDHIYRFFLRFRYPGSLPEDIAEALGVSLSNSLSFEEFFRRLTQPALRPTTLTKFMPREKAEEMFRTALRKERFRNDSLFSYYFNEGWMEFVLQFDEQSRLRRIYLHHKYLKDNFELPIKK